MLHPEFGKGVVEQYRGDRVVILFEKEGSKTLALDGSIEGGLLRRYEGG